MPSAEFRALSLFKADIPPCNAVTSIGECLNYLFDPDSDRSSLIHLFHRIYSALTPGGVFIFDIAEPGQVTQEQNRGFTEGKDWVVLVEKKENPEQETLTRRIISFRKVGEHYRRDDEVHHLRLYKATDIARELGQVGFQVQTMRSYGQYSLPKEDRSIHCTQTRIMLFPKRSNRFTSRIHSSAKRDFRREICVYALGDRASRQNSLMRSCEAFRLIHRKSTRRVWGVGCRV